MTKLPVFNYCFLMFVVWKGGVPHYYEFGMYFWGVAYLV